MSKRYTLSGLALIAGLITAPAFADGTPGQTPFQGPPPLQAHPAYPSTTPCHNDCIVPFAPQRQTYTPPPVYRPVPQPVSYDFSGFSGGVGAGVNGGFYGGGGTIVFNNARRFSGVLSHRASAFTFRHRGGGGKMGGGKHHGGGMKGGH